MCAFLPSTMPMPTDRTDARERVAKRSLNVGAAVPHGRTPVRHSNVLPDGQIRARAAATGRALVTANIKDFNPLDAQYRAAGQEHAGLILVSAKTFPQNRSYTSALISALAALLDEHEQIEASQITSLPRH
jgi:hypothetical protein